MLTYRWAISFPSVWKNCDEIFEDSSHPTQTTVVEKEFAEN